jgi:two-component system, cell cycle response regulator CpdR
MKVLFVEDEADLLELVSDALEANGFEVRQVGSADDAMVHLRSDEAFDFMISDVMMPGSMTGIDLAREAATLSPGMSVVLTSGHPLSSLAPLPAESKFLSKPYRTRQLLDLLKAESK